MGFESFQRWTLDLARCRWGSGSRGMLNGGRFLTARLVCGRTCLHNDEAAGCFVAAIKNCRPHSDQSFILHARLIYDPRFNLFDACALALA